MENAPKQHQESVQEFDSPRVQAAVRWAVSAALDAKSDILFKGSVWDWALRAAKEGWDRGE